MDARLFKRVSELFDAASRLPAGERTAFLAAECDDAAVRAEVESLLSHADTPAAAVRTQAVNAALSSSLSEFRERDPEQIGQFRILRRLGQGGMGVVYLAEQANPRREVALKLIRPALTAPDLLRRFEHETQVLARLRHPGIAQLYETGWAETDGRRVPYFAMEYAPGPPLTEYAHRNGLDVRERVELFIRVCDAVQHAHQRGVIHRDLKPANILVTEEGTETRARRGVEDSKPGDSTARGFAASALRGTPKVLDFGVARVTDGDVKMTTVQTDVGQLIGTLAYMSPEQIDGDPLAIDTRSDVYTLGVIFYELLSGSLPHGPPTTSIPERIRVIKEVAPARLSSINRRLRGDLDTIAHKALEKSPSRRYASAAEFGADLQHYLRNEPIQARPPSLGYQIAKFTARNRALVIGAAVAVLALIGGAIGTTWQAVRATREQHRAENALHDAETQRAIAEGALVESERQQAIAKSALSESQRQQKRAEEALAESTRQQGIAKSVNEFLNEILTAADLEKPTDERDENVSEVLARAERRVKAGSLGDEPEVEADVRSLLAKMSKQLGLYEPAIAHLQRVLELRTTLLGRESNGVAQALADLGDVYLAYRRFEDAEPLLREALPLAERLQGSGAVLVATISSDLAQVVAAKGDVAGATALNRRAIDILAALGADQDAYRAVLLNNQGNVLRDSGDYAAAEPYYREALAIVRERLGAVHFYAAKFLNNLALTLKLLGRVDEALPLYREALEIRRKLLPADHPDIAESLNNLSSLLGQTGKVDEAEPLAREALGILQRALPPGHLYTGYASRTLGNMLLRLDRYAEAEPHLLASYEIFTKQPPQPGDPVRKAATLLADLYEKWNAAAPEAGRAAEAVRWRERAATSQPASGPGPS